MALGRGSAVVLLLSLCFLLLHSHMAHAATYTVGGTGGWTFNTVAWPKGKRFKAGDTLGSSLHISDSFFFLKFCVKHEAPTTFYACFVFLCG